MNNKTLLASALIAGLVAGSMAIAQDAPTAAGDTPPAKSKNSCKGKNGCKHHKGKDHKNSCKSKDGCKGKDAAPAPAAGDTKAE